MSFEKISVIGLGYIGLPTAAVLAAHGHTVIGVDVNAHAVATINSGKAHITEPDLDVTVQSAVASGRLRAVTAAEPADAFIIAVPTPFKDGYEPDVSFVRAAALSIAPALRPGNLVILESTSPVGTTSALSEWLAEARPDLTMPSRAGEQSDIHIAYCPERVLPGKVIRELVENDRIIGGLSDRSTDKAAELYALFVKGLALKTNARTAEMCKLVENSFRDVNIAFANELSIVCAGLGINVWELIKLANHHPRVNILQPGPGVGGHCIAVDPWFIVHSSPEHARLIRTAREVNDSKPDFVMAEIKSLANRFKAPRIACLGLSFKPDIDDLRESPAVEIVKQLALDAVGELLVVEPHVNALPKELATLPGIRLTSLAEAVEHADIVVMLVNHRDFKALDIRLLTNKLLVDTRGEWASR
ncbi:UDP-N-acetyl-D-mannosamine dehydrogenase [Devosia sediminis]|uniref:UDP-N-acetyl-D-mannosamine dehydrogenase n=1 Tax=Devosia sediminis TaxID=2798801 RepID=A0A934IZH8_9HYPH|nr:UDP-N-acetyl-D-mannosamine dehydrogenase [Devosia sediminis]MBJ3785060.1 UDP-N-acetyl-D-mannosamine dehydrogenase [Devosia sediminis]